MKLNFENGTRKLISEVDMESIKKHNEIIVFGAGESGSYLVSILRLYGVEPSCYCDNAVSKQGRDKDGLKIFSLEEALKRHPTACFCIASLWADEIKQQIKELYPGLGNQVYDILGLMVWELKNKTVVSMEYEYISKNMKEFEALSGLFKDKQSNETLENILNYRVSRDKKYLVAACSNEEEYFDRDIIPDGIFVMSGLLIDAGAFDGDTIKQLVKIHPENTLSCVCYEPDKDNIARLKNNLNKISTFEVITKCAGLYDKYSSNALLEGGSLGGRVDDTLGGNVQLEMLDDLNDERPIRMIKMDIEGAEQRALRGGEHRIIKDRPILAICAYHQQNDLIEISNFMRGLIDYSVYLRHYMVAASETIMYAVPNELVDY